MKVLVACEFSGRVRDAFLKKGHDAISCDLLPTESPGPHYQGNALDIINNGYDLMIAHPPCTYLTNAGVRHLHDHCTSKNGKHTAIYGKARWSAMYEACEFFNKLRNAPIEHICIENPVPHKYARERIGRYSQIINPWEYGHGEKKRTCLWLKNLPLLVPTNIVEGRKAVCHLMPDTKNQGKLRSLTYQGIADAIAEQYSRYING